MEDDSDEEIEVEEGDNFPKRCPITQKMVQKTTEMVRGSCCKMLMSRDGAESTFGCQSQVQCPHPGCNGYLHRNNLVVVPHPKSADAKQGRAKRSRTR